MKPFEIAVKTAIKTYAESAGVSVAETVARYRKHESTRESIALLVLVQANPQKLAALAAEGGEA